MAGPSNWRAVASASGFRVGARKYQAAPIVAKSRTSTPPHGTPARRSAADGRASWLSGMLNAPSPSKLHLQRTFPRLGLECSVPDVAGGIEGCVHLENRWKKHVRVKETVQMSGPARFRPPAGDD